MAEKKQARLTVKAAKNSPDEREEFITTGQTARALVALHDAGTKGVTALEVSSWAYRFGAYVFDLRHDHGLNIETLREDHSGPAGPGWHGRYVLHTPVEILTIAHGGADGAA